MDQLDGLKELLRNELCLRPGLPRVGDLALKIMDYMKATEPTSGARLRSNYTRHNESEANE